MKTVKVIIKDAFYEFQNEKTDTVFDKQKQHLSALIKEYEDESELEQLLTALFSLYNLSEALLNKIVEEQGLEKIVKILNAKTVSEKN